VFCFKQAVAKNKTQTQSAMIGFLCSFKATTEEPRQWRGEIDF